MQPRVAASTTLAMAIRAWSSVVTLGVSAFGMSTIGVGSIGAQGFAPAVRITEQQSGVTALLQAVSVVNGNVVWASGHQGAVVRTINGGLSWQRKRVDGGDSLEFRDVHAVNADTAWIMAAGSGNKSRIYRTNDGGGHWQLQFTNTDSAAFYDCFTFFDSRRAIAYSDASHDRTLILRTEDGGANWALLPASAVPAPEKGEGAFAASGLCAASSGDHRAWIATGAPSSRLFRSDDAGKSWNVFATPFVHGAVAGMSGIAFRDRDHGMAVAANIADLRTDTSSAVVGVTDDGGRTWALRARPGLPGALAGVAWVPGEGAETAVVVGFGGAFVTANAGKSWRTISDEVFTGVGAFGRIAWIAGANGRIVRLDW